MEFYLGVHHPNWLEEMAVPAFVSDSTLAKRKTLPRAISRCAIDSAAFMTVSKHGCYPDTEAAFAERARRYVREIGNVDWVSCRDFMCEPEVLRKTGMSVRQHQALTVQSYLTLRDLAPEVPWTPAIQGWTAGDYLDCIELYEKAGVKLSDLPVVGMGSVCKRQTHLSLLTVFLTCQEEGIRLHGYGIKTQGLRNFGKYLYSADSMAASFDARHSPPLPGHDRPLIGPVRPGERRPMGHKHCGNCLPAMLQWRSDLLESMTSRHHGATA